jgi:hypothetical protein
MGGERLDRLAPATDPQIVATLLAATSETVRYLAAHHQLLRREGGGVTRTFSAA